MTTTASGKGQLPSDATAEIPGPAPTGEYRLTLAVLALGVVTYSLVQSLLVPVLPEIQHRMHTTQVATTWVLTAYLLSASVSTPLIGRIGDAVGKKKMLVFVLSCLSVGSLLAALAPNIGCMIAARAVQGMGGGVLPVSFGLLRDRFPASRLGGAVALLSSLTAAGFGCGVVLAGPIVHVLGFRWLFLLPMIATLIGTIGALKFVPESDVRHRGAIPVLPAVLLSGWLVCLLLAVSQGERWGWGSAAIAGLLGGAVALCVGWLAVERRAPVPLIDLAMMRRRGIWTSNVVALLAGFGTYTAYGFLPQFFQTPKSTGYGFGASISQAGVMILPTPAVSFLFGMTAAFWVRRTSLRIVLVSGALLTGIPFVFMALAHHNRHLVVVWTAIQGSGAGLSYASLAAAVLLAVPLHQSGVASGMNANIRTIGGAIGTAVIAAVLAANKGPAGLPTEHGYVIMFIVIATAFFCAAAMSFLVPASPVSGSPGEARAADAALVDAALHDAEHTDAPPRPGSEAVP